MKRKISMAAVFAIILTLAIGGAALAAGLGVFHHFAGAGMNEQSAARLDRLEEAADPYGDTRSAQAPASAATDMPPTVRDAILGNLYERRFDLTLNQAYCDGHKLYYTYTLTTDSPMAVYTGDGKPTGFSDWDMQAEGTYADSYSNADEAITRQTIAFFAEHPTGYVARESMCVGDGADMNGKPLMILDSGEEWVDERTIQGFQEVEMPEGFAAEGEVEIELSILYGARIFWQDETRVYSAHVATPENRGILRLPFTVALNGQTETYTGAVKTSAYGAKAAVRVSDVDISGEVVFDAPEWAAAFEANAQANGNLAVCVSDYTLVADGEALHNLDGTIGVNEDGQLTIGIRYDLPKSMNSLVLKPVTPAIPGAEENIVLTK